MSNHRADGCVSNVSQEDPPTAAELDNPTPLAPEGTQPHHQPGEHGESQGGCKESSLETLGSTGDRGQKLEKHRYSWYPGKLFYFVAQT